MIAQVFTALRRTNTWIWIAACALGAYLVYLLVAGLLTPEAPQTPGSNQIVMRGIITQGQNGRSGWRFEASNSEISPDGFTTTYHDVRNATFFRDGRPAYHLAANLVTVDTRSQNYSANGAVHVWSTDKTLPEDLKTDDAYWNQAGTMFQCPGQTTFVYHGTTMRTTHMTVNLQTGASQLGETSFDYFKIPSPAPAISAAPIPTAIPIAAPSQSP